MKNKKALYIVLLFLAITAALSFTAIRTIALIDEFEVSVGYYAHDAVFPSVFTWGAVAVVAIIFIVTFIIRRALDSVNQESESGAIIFSAALMSFMIIAVLISDIFALDGLPDTFTLLSMIFAFPAALYPLIGVAIPIKSKNGKILLSAFLMLWLFAVTLNIYFADGVAINNPNRTLELTTIACYLLFFVNECRYNVGTAKGWSYIAFGLSSVVVGGLYSLPNIILALMNSYPDTLDFTFELILCVIWLYALMRMCVHSGDLDEIAEAEEEEADVYDEEPEQTSETEVSNEPSNADEEAKKGEESADKASEEIDILAEITPLTKAEQIKETQE